MKSGRIILWIFLSLLLFSCDKNKDDYSGLSDLIAERNEVRQSISEAEAEKKARKKSPQKAETKDSTKIIKKKKELSSIVLYERDIEIVDSFSRKGLAKGVASMNKEGKIIKIKIISE